MRRILITLVTALGLLLTQAFAQTEFTISVKVAADGEVTATIDDSVIPEVRVSQHAVIVEAGQLGEGAKPLDLDDIGEDGNPKYFPAVLREPPTEDDEVGKKHEFKTIAELGVYLDEIHADEERSPSPWVWDGLTFTRTLAATRTSTPAQLRLAITTRHAAKSLATDIMDLIDSKTGKPIAVTTQRLRFPDGTITKGQGEAALHLQILYKVPPFRAEVAPGQVFEFPGGGGWGHYRNRWIDGGSRPVWVRMVIGEYLNISPPTLTVDVLEP